MSAGGAFGGAKGYQPRPPEKGVFPLDHFGECKAVKEDYLTCLKEHAGQSEECREVAKLYLKCRMERKLMAEQDLADLGFSESNDAAAAQQRAQQQQRQQEKEKEPPREKTGFVAGLHK